MSTALDPRSTTTRDRPRTTGGRRGTTRGRVLRRRLSFWLVLTGLVVWAWSRAQPADGDVLNGSSGALLRDLAGRALTPRLDGAFLQLVGEATLVTLAFAALGTAGALLLGIVGGAILSDVAWPGRVPPVWRAARTVVRTVLVALRSIHELVWALLLVSVLGLDPLVAVLALIIPFGAQTAQVFAATLDGADTGPYLALRRSGAPQVSALLYALVPAASRGLLSYSFYRFECSVRSTVLLGFVGAGGIGQELVVSLQSRNWEEVWTLVYALLLLSAVVEIWSARVRREVAGTVPASSQAAQRTIEREDDAEGTVAAVIATGPLRTSGPRSARPVRVARRRPWSRVTMVLLLPALVGCWVAADLSLDGLADPLTWELSRELLADLVPPELPEGGAGALVDAAMDTVAMAVLAMAIAVGVTVTVGPWAAGRSLLRYPARLLLLALRSVPPTVWAVLALFVLFPGVLPGALALGLYAAGILGRLVAEAWESQDRAAARALERAGTPAWLAGLAAVLPGSTHQLLTYTLYRFEVSIRDTAVVGVVGAAGLGRLFAENLSTFQFSVVSSLLVVSFLLSVAVEHFGRRLRRSLAH